jgi:hypothetical protein
VPVSSITVTYAPRGVVTDAGFNTASSLACATRARQAGLARQALERARQLGREVSDAQALTIETWQATETGAIAVGDLGQALFGVEGRKR